MLKIKPTKLILLSAIPFFCGAVVLIRKGLDFIHQASQLAGPPFPHLLPLGNFFLTILRREEAVIAMVVLGLILGIFKGRMVIVPRTETNLTRLLSLKGPAPLSKIYDKRGWIVLSSMVSLGLMLNFLPIPLDIRGVIDIGIGIALLQGSTRAIQTLLKRKKSIST